MKYIRKCDLCVGKDEFRYIEDLGECVSDLVKENKLIVTKIVILNYYKSGSIMRIRPSLSLSIDKDGYKLFTDLYDMLNIIISNMSQYTDDGHKIKYTYDFILSIAPNHGYRIVQFYDLKIIFLIYDNAQDALNNDKKLLFLSKKIYTFKKNSLNIYNDSSRKTREIVNKVRENHIFTQSKEQTLFNIVKYFKEEYKTFLNEIYLYKYDFNNNLWSVIGKKCSENKYDYIINDKSNKLFYKKKSYYPRVPLSGKIEANYFLIFPFVKDYNTEYFKYVIFLTTENPIKKYIFANLDAVISDYFNYYLENEKKQLLHYLQNELIKASARTDYYTRKDKNLILKEFVDGIFETIVSITNAYSITMRLYNPSDNSLELFADKNSEDGTRNNTDKYSKISLNTYRKKSINCRVYEEIDKKDNPYLLRREEVDKSFFYKLSKSKTKVEKKIISYFSEKQQLELSADVIKFDELIDTINTKIIPDAAFFDINIFDKIKITKSFSIEKVINKKYKNKYDYMKLNRLIIERYYPNYIKKHTENYIYEPNLIKTNYYGHLRVRNQTVSEICFPLYFKKLKIGVINLESPILNAFDEETDPEKCYIFFLINLIEEYIRILYEVNDIKWLSRLVVNENNLHELKQIINGLDVLPNNTKDAMKDLLSCKNITFGNNKEVPISNLIHLKEKYILSILEELKFTGLPLLNKEIKKDYERALSINVWHSQNKHIDYDKFEMIKIIYFNMATNFSKFCNCENDDLILNYIPKNNTIEIHLNTLSPFPIDYNEYYFEAPYESISSNNNSDLHSGLFIIGVLVRQLSGFIKIIKNENDYINNVIIIIPI